MNLSEDFIYEDVKKDTERDDFVYGLGKYAVTFNSLSIGVALSGVVGNAISGSPLAAAFFVTLAAYGVLQRPASRKCAADAREYFRQKDAEASADPAGP
jgi:hypothetical protein